MSYNKSKYYQDNLQHSIGDMNKTPEKQFLVRGHNNYSNRTTLNAHHAGGGHQRQPSSQSRHREPLNVFERQTLLGPGPVKLTPSWEEKNLPNDELNFKNLKLEDYLGDKPPHDRMRTKAPLAVIEELRELNGDFVGHGSRTKPINTGPSMRGSYQEVPTNGHARFDWRNKIPVRVPKDRCNLVYLILLLHGIGTLMPWNIFITAEQYFMEHKLNTTTSAQYPLAEEYHSHFLSYLGLAAQIPNVVFNWLNLFVQIGGDMTTRIVVSIVIEVVVVIGTIILAMIDSSSWPGIFFWVTMGSVVLLNMANGIYQNSVYGMASKLPMRYCNAVVMGSNISGTLTAVIIILSIFGSPNIRTAAIYYFIAALFVLLACFDTYFALPLLRFYRFYDKQSIKEAEKRGRSQRIPYFTIFKKTFPQLFNVWLIFFVTLSVFPAVLANIKMIDPKFFTTEKYFTPVTCFLFFNVSAMMGNLCAFFVRWPGPSCLSLPVVLRILMVPYFMFCNYMPKNRQRILPILFYNDWAYAGMCLALGWTGGYLSSLAMMYAPRCVEPQYAGIAGMMAAASLCLGLFCGVNFSLVISWFVENFTFYI